MNRRSRQRTTDEVAGAALDNKARTKRVKRIADRLSARPGASIPHAMVTEADLEGFYRFIRNDEVPDGVIAAAHRERSLARCEERGTALLLHDTSGFTFGGESKRSDLGPINDAGQGFHGHFCLAVTPQRIPLGVVGLHTYARPEKPKRKKVQKKKKSERESQRWIDLALDTGTRAKGRFKAIHVMDSEADDYDLYSALCRAEERFVIRAAQNRKVDDAEGTYLHDALEGARVRLKRLVPLSERRPKEAKSRSKRNGPRRERIAELEISARQVRVCRPATAGRDCPESLLLNYVHVREVNAPAGVELVDWVLVTTQPIRTKDDVASVVDAYRARWTIEEFFKALKTGCRYQDAQLETFERLVRYLEMLLPVAWQLLMLRSISVDDPDAPATSFLTSEQLTVLRALSERTLPRRLTVGAAVLAIARLGGYIKANGPPGWLVLGRAMQRIHDGVDFMKRLHLMGKTDLS